MSIQIPGFVIFNEVAHNDQYVTYQGIRESDQKPVLIKTFASAHPTLEDLANIKNEYEITKEIETPQVLRTLDFDKFQNQLYLVYEDAGFESLEKLLKSRLLSLQEELTLAIHIAEAVGAYQTLHLIHKDLVPDNIYVKPETLEVRITGFGYATKQIRQKLSAKNPSIIERQAAYISPEQTGRMNRDIDYRTDFYSLGIIFYEIFTGKRPFASHDIVELIHAHIAIQPVSPKEANPNLPKQLSDIIMKLISKTVEERYSSALALAKDLKHCLRDLETKGKIDPFPIGANDVSPIFQISQKLYGRENEVKVLQNLVETIAHDPPQLALIGGFSGIGKSSLISEMQKPVFEKGGFFIIGKFDQFKTNFPYSAFIQALQDLVQHILTESEERIQYWRDKILESLGANAGVITDVLPELRLIIGEPQRPQELDTEQTHNRFSIVFQLFIKTFATPLTPLTIFLDDMQWIDSASLKLIEMLLTSHQMRGLLIIGAYRSNEVDRFHQLSVAVDRIKQSYSKVTELEINPLTLSQVTELAAETLHRSMNEVKELAKIVFDKTQGNPFFINQLLTFLQEEKYIEFNLERGEWIWHTDKIVAAGLTDNIITLIVNKLQKCSEVTRKILMLAACTGHSFDASLINHIADYPPDVILKHIQEAINEGFIVPDEHIAEVYWDPEEELEVIMSHKGQTRSLKFPHDRVRQAAYSLIEPNERKALHYQIGKILLESLSDHDREEKIFDIVYQINHAFELIKNPKERLKYAELNLHAGEKAMNAVAYLTASEYLRAGLNFLPNDRWKLHYDLAFQLQIKLAECSFLIGDYDEARELFDHTLRHVQTDKERIEIYVLRIKLFTSTTEYADAIQNGRLALKLLGINIPVATSKLDILMQLAKVKWLLFKKTENELLNIPKIDDPRHAQIINIMFLLIAPAYLSTRELYAYIVVTGLIFCLKWGYCPASSYFFAGYGIIRNILFKDIPGASFYGRLALNLCDRFVDQSSVPATQFLVGSFIGPTTRSIRSCIEILKNGFEMGITVGDFIYGVYALAQLMTLQFFSGKNLNEVYRDLQEDIDFVSKVKAHNRGYMFFGCQATILALKGKTYHPSSFSSDTFNEEAFFKAISALNFHYSLFFVYMFKMQITFLFDKYEEALEYSLKSGEIGHAVKGHPINIERDYYTALSLTQLSTHKPPEVVRENLKKAYEILKRLKLYANYCPVNYLNKYYLIKAEIARLNDDRDQAIELYDKAIESAKENSFIQNEAIANELFAKFWIDQNKLHLAKQYLIEAHYDYYCWGADAKVKDLEDKYPQILNKSSAPFGLREEKQELMHDSPSRTIDLNAVFKAAEVISSQIELETLIKELLKLVQESAGAERTLLILEVGGKWQIRAEQGHEGTRLDLAMPLDKSQGYLAYSLIMYVLRTKEAVIAADAEKEGLFTGDPYVSQNHVKSLMGLPLIHQTKLIGVIYLENNLATSAFTTERTELLKLLSSQIANSVENALLFEKQANLSFDLQKSNIQLEDYSQNLEKKVYLRTHELKEKNEQLQETLKQIKDMQKKLIQQEKLVSLGSVAKTIASEMRNPLNYIFNFSELSQELIKELEQNKSASKETLETVATNLGKINEHAKKADEIITSLLEESRGKEDMRELTDINKLIRDYADLVYYNYYKKDPLFILTIETAYDADLPKVLVSPQNLGRVIYNVIDNACYATDIKKKDPANVAYTPVLSITTALKENSIYIVVRDNGIGISPSLLSRIFTPFTTNKPTGKGAGMGLSISHDIIVQEHQGTITIDSEENQFTEVTITLPV